MYEIHRYWSRDQLENETIGQCTTELRTRAANCDFQESDNKTRDTIVFGIRDRSVQEKLLREYDRAGEEAKVESIVGIPAPACTAGLQRIMGMVLYLAVYIPNESANTAPLRMLLRQDVEWNWNHEHDKALSQIRRALVHAPTLEYYNVHTPGTIQCDASQRGLGASIMQESRIRIACINVSGRQLFTNREKNVGDMLFVRDISPIRLQQEHNRPHRPSPSRLYSKETNRQSFAEIAANDPSTPTVRPRCEVCTSKVIVCSGHSITCIH